MENNKYNLSIVIPTKNRQEYCIKAIMQILKYTNIDTQIVIQDNSDDSSYLRNSIIKLSNERIKYNYNGNVLSFVDNFNEALSLADGDYICMIGDDDGILPSINDALEYMKKNDCDCYIPGQNAVYIWPNADNIVKNSDNGYLCLSNLKDNIRNVNVKDSLNKLLSYGFQDYQKTDVPRLYHGIVKSTILRNIKDICGFYFSGLTPDMFMVVALCIVCKNVVACDLPISIAGVCPKSGSAASVTGKHTGNLKDAPHFVGHSDYKWNESIPAIYTVETIWAETGLHALNDLKHEELIKKFNYEEFLLKLLYKYPQFKKEIKNHINANTKISIFKIIKYKIISFNKLYVKILKKIFRSKKNIVKYYDVVDIEMATVIINDKINKIKGN